MDVKNRKKMRGKSQKGAALLIAILFFLIISVTIVVGSAGTVIGNRKSAQNLIKSKSSYFTSEAGAEDALYRVKKNKQISSPEITSLNDGTVSVTVTDSGGGEKEIIAAGDVSNNARNIKTSVTTGEGFDFFYGAQVGEGGLEMKNNTIVQGVGGANGNVYSNGPVTGETGSDVTGNLTVATSITEDTQSRSLVCNQDQIVGRANPQIDFAQSFTASDSLPLYKISLYVKKVGDPSNKTVRIVADNSGSPDTNDLAEASLSSALVTSNYGWVDITFSDPADMISGQTYWIILDTSQDSNRYYVWCKDSNNGFGNGVAKYKQSWGSGGGWSLAIAGDLTFKTYLGSGSGLINNVSVLGDARANNITNSNVSGMAYCQIGSGNNKACNTSQPDPSIANMPISQGNIDEWKADAEAGGVIIGNCGNGGVAGCNFSSGDTISLGPKKIIGDLTLDNGKTVVLTGILHFTGNISINNNSAIRCDGSFGSSSCIIIADGWINTGNGSTFSGSGQAGSYLMALSTIEGCNGEGGLSWCGGQENDAGIILENNVTGAVFYTTKSMIVLNNNAYVKEIIGYKVKLKQNSFVRYETGLMNANFTSGPSGGWNIKSWKEVE